MCVSPLLRFRLKCKPPKDFSFFSEVYNPKTKGFVIKSQAKIEKMFKSYGHFLAFFEKYCDYIVIPCGKCIECRKTYARDWSLRCYCESMMHDTSCFITLTLDSLANKKYMEEIERSFNKNGRTNVHCKYCVNGNKYFNFPIDYSLNKPFIYSWLKKLRDTLYRRYNVSIRYFGCGEYGSEGERPHYHLLIFGYNFPSRIIFDKKGNKKKEYRKTKVQFSKKGVQMFVSDELMELWQYGNSFVEDLNLKACEYVAKYCMKKIKFFDAESEYDYYYGRVPEFLMMSRGNCQSNRCKYIDDIIKNCNGIKSLRDMSIKYCKDCNKTRGGLGYDWFLKYYKDVLRVGKINFEGVEYPIPKYFLDILKITDVELWHAYKTCLYTIYYDKKQEHPEEYSTERLNVKKAVKKARNRVYHDRCGVV